MEKKCVESQKQGVGPFMKLQVLATARKQEIILFVRWCLFSLQLVGINPASPSPRPACVGVLQPVTSLVATLTLVRPQHHARLLERLGATSSLAPGPKRQDFLAHLRTTREGRGSEMDADRNFAAPAVDDQTVRVKKVAVGGPKSTAMLFLEDVFSSDKKQREVPTLSTDRRRREDPALSGQGSPQANDVSTSHSAEASGGTSEEQFVVRYASDSELYASLQLLFRSSRQPADASKYWISVFTNACVCVCVHKGMKKEQLYLYAFKPTGLPGVSQTKTVAATLMRPKQAEAAVCGLH